MEPVSVTVGVGWIVSLLTAWAGHKKAVVEAEAKGAPAPAPPEDRRVLAQGEQAMEVVKKAVAEHGSDDDRSDLAAFERNPERYRPVLERALADLAGRAPAFAERVQVLARDAQVQTAGVIGQVHVSGGEIIGPVIGAVGTMTVHSGENRESDESGSK